MACKHLTSITRCRTSPGAEDQAAPLLVEEPACELGREPGRACWSDECERTPARGPCWWWSEQFPLAPDLRF